MHPNNVVTTRNTNAVTVIVAKNVYDLKMDRYTDLLVSMVLEQEAVRAYWCC